MKKRNQGAVKGPGFSIWIKPSNPDVDFAFRRDVDNDRPIDAPPARRARSRKS